MKSSIYFILILAICMSSCQFNTKRTNKKKDKIDAENVIAKFYAYAKVFQYDSIFTLIDITLPELSDTAKLAKMHRHTVEKLGPLISQSLEKWETQVIEGTNPSAKYFFVYKNKYQNAETIEIFNLEKYPNGKILITKYTMNSNKPLEKYN